MRGKLIRGVIGDVYLSDAALWERYRDEKEMIRVGILAGGSGDRRARRRRRR